MSLQTRILALNSSTKRYEPVELDASGNVKISGSLSTTGLATEANQTLLITDTTAIKNSVASMDSKMSSLASEATLGLVATESTLSTVSSTLTTMSTALVKSDTDNVSVISMPTITELNSTNILSNVVAVKTALQGTLNVDDAAGLVKLGSIETLLGGTLSVSDSAIINCDTSAVVISSGSITETNSASQLAELQTLSGTVSSGKVNVELATPANKGSRGGISNNATILSNGVSSSAPTITGYGADAQLYVEDATTGQVDGYAVEVSNDSGVNWQHYAVLFMEDNYNATLRVGSMKVNCSGLTNIRIRNIASVSVANCVASIYA